MNMNYKDLGEQLSKTYYENIKMVKYNLTPEQRFFIEEQKRLDKLKYGFDTWEEWDKL